MANTSMSTGEFLAIASFSMEGSRRMAAGRSSPTTSDLDLFLAMELLCAVGAGGGGAAGGGGGGPPVVSSSLPATSWTNPAKEAGAEATAAATDPSLRGPPAVDPLLDAVRNFLLPSAATSFDALFGGHDGPSIDSIVDTSTAVDNVAPLVVFSRGTRGTAYAALRRACLAQWTLRTCTNGAVLTYRYLCEVCNQGLLSAGHFAAVLRSDAILDYACHRCRSLVASVPAARRLDAAAAQLFGGTLSAATLQARLVAHARTVGVPPDLGSLLAALPLWWSATEEGVDHQQPAAAVNFLSLCSRDASTLAGAIATLLRHRPANVPLGVFRDLAGTSALHLCVQQGLPAAVEMLLAADPCCALTTTPQGDTALDYLVLTRRSDDRRRAAVDSRTSSNPTRGPVEGVDLATTNDTWRRIETALHEAGAVSTVTVGSPTQRRPSSS